MDNAEIEVLFETFILDNGLSNVVFHSLRHTNITYKLDGGDIKSLQGDSDHSQAQMITERYSSAPESSLK